MTVPHSYAWQKPSSHFLPACAALQRRLASLNVRKSCDCWLKTFWWAKIQLRFVTAFQSPRAHPQTKGRALLSAEITFCVRGVNAILLVIAHVLADQTAKVFFIHRDNMVQDLAAAASDPSFGSSVLPW